MQQGKKVRIVMEDHSCRGMSGTVEMVLQNPEGLPEAVLVNIGGFKDWFFGTPQNIEVDHA